MKKILVLILSFILVMQFGTAYAGSETVEVLPDSPDMIFATSIGLFEEGTDQSAPLTRIDLAGVYYRIFLSDIEPYMDYSRFFSDVDFDSAAYADFVYQCGIMNGVGGELFEPDTNVTYAQVMKTVVSFLGYTELAESKGGYPYGYLAVAQTLGLVDSMPPSIDSIVTVNKVASIFRLATNVELMERVTFGTDDVKYEIDDDSDYLNAYMHITRIRGVVTANYLSDIEGNDELEYGQIKVSDELFYITEASNNLINELGCEVDIYVKSYETSKTSSIMYYELTDANDILTIDGEDVKELKSSSVEYYNDEKEKNAKIGSDTKVVYNGSLASSYDNSVVNPFRNSSLEGSLRLVDNDNDGTYEVIIVDAYSSYIVKNVVNNVIFNELLPEETVDLGYSFKDGDIEITNVIGQPIMLSELEEGDIINVSRDTDGNVKRIVVTIDTFTGVLKGINESENIIDIDGHEFEFSKNLISNPKSDFTDIKLGTKVTLYFNKGGKVSDIKAFDAQYKTGYLVDAKKSKGIEDDWKMRIFSSSGEFEDLPLAEKVKVRNDGKVMAEDLIGSLTEEINIMGKDDSGNSVVVETLNKVARQVVLYTTNEDGELNWIDYATDTQIRDGLYKMANFDGTASRKLYYRSSQKNFGAELLLGAGTVVFNVPEEADWNNWSRYYAETSSYYSDGTYTIDFIAYGTDENGSPCAHAIVEYDGKKAISSTADAFVIDKVSEIIDENGEEKVKMSGYIYGSLVTYYAEKEVINAGLYGEKLKRGDIIRIKTVDSEVKTVIKVFDFDRRSFLKSGTDSDGNNVYMEAENPTASDFYNAFRCTYGEVVYNDGQYIKVKSEGADVEQVYPLANFKIVEIDFSDDEKGVMRTSSTTRVFDTQSYPGYSSKVVIQTRNGDARTLVLYNGLGGAN